jgi:hypothetical protein
MFYPRLYEEVENLGPVDMATIKSYMGKSSSKVKVDPVDDEVLKVDDKVRSDKITIEDYIKAKGKYKENLKRFLEAFNYDVEKNEQNYLTNKKKSKLKTKSEPLPVQDIQLTYGDFWNYQLSRIYDEYDLNDIDVESKPKEIQKLEDYPEEFEISVNVVSYFEQNGKGAEFKNWISNIPTGTKITPSLIRFFRLIDQILTNESKKPLKISGVVDIKGLSIKQLDPSMQQSWLKHMIQHIAAYNAPEDLNKVYISQVLKHGEFLNALFMIDAQGVGRGELLMTYCIPGSKFPGGGESYDLLVSEKNKDLVEIKGVTYEIKDYSNVEKKGKGTLDSIRLGTGGKLTRFKFWKNLEKTIEVAKTINSELSKEDLDQLLDPYFKKIWANLISEKPYTEKGSRAISSAVKAGELSDEKILMIKLWYYLAHELVQRGLSEEKGDVYTIATLKGRGVSPKSVSISPINPEDLKGGIKIDVESGKDLQRAIQQLATLEYVKNPDQFQEDMDNVANEYFNHNEDIDFFLVFRPEKINIVGENGFKFAKITQAAVKIIEKEYVKPGDEAKRAYNKWKDAIDDFKKKAPKEVKNSYNQIEKEISYKDFYKRELLGESYYPRLFK